MQMRTRFHNKVLDKTSKILHWMQKIQIWWPHGRELQSIFLRYKRYFPDIIQNRNFTFINPEATNEYLLKVFENDLIDMDLKIEENDSSKVFTRNSKKRYGDFGNEDMRQLQKKREEEKK